METHHKDASQRSIQEIEMQDFSTLIGGIAGDGINEAGLTLSRLFSRLGHFIYMYYDYPSLIRGGHNFSIVRASKRRIGAHRDSIDVLVALNQDSLDRHSHRLKDGSVIVYDSDRVKIEGRTQKSCGIATDSILKEVQAPPIMKNTCILGGYCRAVGIDWRDLEQVLSKHIPKKLELNLLVARRGYETASQLCRVEGQATESPAIESRDRRDDGDGGDEREGQARQEVLKGRDERVGMDGQDGLDRRGNGGDEPKDGPNDGPKAGTMPILTGNQALGLGLIRAGLEAYIAYPMTPSSSVLDFMAKNADRFGLTVVHPENEIAVMLMAEGFAYAGVRAAVGTSGGGFCLMAEGLSLSGMAELPVVVVMAQRAGPSTGLPTYTAQGDLNFVLNAGHGEFPRFVASPGNAEQAYWWASVALNLAWRYQIPSFILTDKTVSESQYSFEAGLAGLGEENGEKGISGEREVKGISENREEPPLLWNGGGRYRRYLDTDSGISPLAFPPVRGQTVKSDSYNHDEDGITSEESAVTEMMSDKRARKAERLAEELESYESVHLGGERGSGTALLTWGSNMGVCEEAAELLGLRMIQPIVLSPFPKKRLAAALSGVERCIAVECNRTGQLAEQLSSHGIKVDEKILKYDGRPFSLEELLKRLEGIGVSRRKSEKRSERRSGRERKWISGGDRA